MEMSRLGDLTVSVIGLGCNNFARKIDQQASTAVVDAALDAGINFFDTSNAYGYGDHPYSGRGKSEEFLGTALGARRADVIVATKFGNPASDTDPTERGAKPEYVHKACNDSLRRLGTDYIDVYQIHRPDPSTPIAETLGALSELVAAGKIRQAGCSNFTEPQIEEAMRASADHDVVRFGSVQNEYSLLHREPEPDVLPACVKHDLAFLPYFPLASGLLTGKYRRGEEPPEGTRLAFWKPREHINVEDTTLDRVAAFKAFAEERGHTVLDLALSWLLTRPAVNSVLVGATSPEQVRANAAASTWAMTPEDLRAFEQV